MILVCEIHPSHKEYAKDENKTKETIKIVLCDQKKNLSRLILRFSKRQASKKLAKKSNFGSFCSAILLSLIFCLVLQLNTLENFACSLHTSGIITRLPLFFAFICIFFLPLIKKSFTINPKVFTKPTKKY